MSVPTTLHLLNDSKKVNEGQIGKSGKPLDLTPKMLDSLGKLAGITLRRDELCMVTQFHDWWQDVLHRLAEMAREIFIISKADQERASQPIWLNLGLSMCQLFLDYVDQLPIQLQRILSTIEAQHVELTSHLEETQSKSPGERLVHLLEGFAAIAGILPEAALSTEASSQKASSVPYSASLAPLLSLKSLQKLLKDVHLLKPILLQKKIPGIDKMIMAIERFIQKRLESPSAYCFSGPDVGNPNSGEVVDLPKITLEQPEPYSKNTPVVYITLDFSYRSARLLTNYIREMTDVTILLTYYSDMLGRCTGTLLQEYQRVWYDYLQTEGSWDRKAAEMDLMESIQDEPELMAALSGTFPVNKQPSGWIAAEKLNALIQEKRNTFLSILDELSSNWNPSILAARIEDIKNQLSQVPSEIHSRWVQTAWEDLVDLQDQLYLVKESIDSLRDSVSS